MLADASVVLVQIAEIWIHYQSMHAYMTAAILTRQGNTV